MKTIYAGGGEFKDSLPLEMLPTLKIYFPAKSS
jgi:hypothetical protein